MRVSTSCSSRMSHAVLSRDKQHKSLDPSKYRTDFCVKDFDMVLSCTILKFTFSQIKLLQ